MIPDVRDRLTAIADELADAALDRLRAATKGDANAATEERKITRARRALEKAIRLLDDDRDYDLDID